MSVVWSHLRVMSLGAWLRMWGHVLSYHSDLWAPQVCHSYTGPWHCWTETDCKLNDMPGWTHTSPTWAMKCWRDFVCDHGGSVLSLCGGIRSQQWPVVTQRTSASCTPIQDRWSRPWPVPSIWWPSETYPLPPTTNDTRRHNTNRPSIHNIYVAWAMWELGHRKDNNLLGLPLCDISFLQATCRCWVKSGVRQGTHLQPFTGYIFTHRCPYSLYIEQWNVHRARSSFYSRRSAVYLPCHCHPISTNDHNHYPNTTTAISLYLALAFFVHHIAWHHFYVFLQRPAITVNHALAWKTHSSCHCCMS